MSDDDEIIEEDIAYSSADEHHEDEVEENPFPSKRPRIVQEATTSTSTTSTEPRKKLPLIEKYRPSTLDEVVAQDDIVQTIQQLMAKKALPHLLFYGPAGSGKTSTILALAKTMYGTGEIGSMVLELNASDSRGIDDVREQVVTFASTKKIFDKGMKLIILDEADNMTKDAQAALRRVIEKYASNTRFCLICNYVSKIIPALQSRCTKFRFSPLKPEHVMGRLTDICNKEKIDCPQDGMDALLKLAKGDMRKVLNLLEASSMQRSNAEDGVSVVVDAALVYQVAGKPTPVDVDAIVETLMNDTLTAGMQKIYALQVEKGLALSDMVTELHDRLRDMDLPSDVIKFLLAQLAECEYRLTAAVDDQIQLAGLVSVFHIARDMITQRLTAGGAS